MKKVQFLLLFACQLGTTAFASSNPKVDSLLRILESDAPGDRVEVLWGIAYELFDVDNPEALFYASRAYKEVWKGGDSLQIVKVGTTYGQLLRRMDQVDESIAVSSRLLPIAKRHNYRPYWKKLLNSMAITYTFTEDYDKALALNLESLTLRQEDGNNQEISIAFLNIGLVHLMLGDYELGIDYSRRSTELDMKAKDSSHLSLSLSNIGFCLVGLGQYTQAQKYFNDAANFLRVSDNDKTCEIAILYGFTKSYFEMGDLERTKIYANLCIVKSEIVMEQRYFISSLILLARTALLENQIELCNAYLSRIEKMPALAVYPYSRLEVYRLRSMYFSRVLDFEKALSSLESHVVLSKSTYSEEINKRIRSVHAEYIQKENAVKIESQSRILNLQQEAIVRQRWLILFVAIILALTVAVVLVLYQSNIRKKRVNILLDERVRERTIELGHQRDVLQHAYDEQTVTRKRMSEEIIALTATLKGLFYLSGRELPVEYRTYFKEAEATTEKIVHAVDHFRSSGRTI